MIILSQMIGCTIGSFIGTMIIGGIELHMIVARIRNVEERIETLREEQ